MIHIFLYLFIHSFVTPNRRWFGLFQAIYSELCDASSCFRIGQQLSSLSLLLLPFLLLTFATHTTYSYMSMSLQSRGQPWWLWILTPRFPTSCLKTPLIWLFQRKLCTPTSSVSWCIFVRSSNHSPKNISILRYLVLLWTLALANTFTQCFESQLRPSLRLKYIDDVTDL